jgi:hypothetical protein
MTEAPPLWETVIVIDTRRNRFAHVLRGSETPLNRRQLVKKTWNFKIPQQLDHQTNAHTNRLSRLKRPATGQKNVIVAGSKRVLS